jgi:phospholipid transport system substrate-binding protein
MKKILVLLSAALFTSALNAYADLMPPDTLVRNTAQEVLAIVKQDKDIQSGNQKKLLDLVDAKVLPHFDFERMTRLTAGKNWRAATPEQKTALVNEFRALLIHTYTAAFTRYENQNVDVKPVRMLPSDDEVTVRTTIFKPGTPPIAVDYEMEKTDSGWKVFDLSVEGASLIATYRGTFAEQIQQSGIDGLIKSLADKNKANAAVPLRKAEHK